MATALSCVLCCATWRPAPQQQTHDVQHGKVFFGHIYILALVSIFCMYLLLNLMTVRPHRPSNVTREFPPSLLMLQGNSLLPF